MRISGTFEVVGITDPCKSDVELCQGAICAARGASFAQLNSTIGGAPPVTVTILARDVDGFALERAHENIAVVLFREGDVAMTLQALYHTASKRYHGVLEISQAGSYSLGLETEAGSCLRFQMVSVACPESFVPTNGRCMEQRSPCESAMAVPSGTTFKVGDQLTLSDLGSATSVEVLPNGQPRGFRIAEGQATLEFTEPGSFLIRMVRADGAQCVLPDARVVVCEQGEHEEHGRCVPDKGDNPCESLRVVDAKGQRVYPASNLGVMLRPGARLHVAFDKEASGDEAGPEMSYTTQLIQLAGMEQHLLTDTIALKNTGRYSLQLSYPWGSSAATKQCTLLQEISVKCSDAEQEVDGQCVPRRCDETGDFWFDVATNQCKQRPAMALRASTCAALSLTVKKQARAPASTQAAPFVEIRLSGVADAGSAVEWIAVSSEKWLRLGQSQGRLDAQSTYFRLPVGVTPRDLQDTGNVPLQANISVRSTMWLGSGRNRTLRFANGTDNMTLTVHVSIQASVHLTDPEALEIVRVGLGQRVRFGDELPLNEGLMVRIHAVDFEGLKISRPDLDVAINLTQPNGLVKLVQLQYVSDDLYLGEVPSSWTDAAGEAALRETP
jgi:hypothetical protein